MRNHWDSKFITGNDDIDEQHQELYRQIDMLVDACYRGENREIITKTVDSVEQYVIEHFQAEEQLLLVYKSPELEIHKREHEEFVGHIARLKKIFDLPEADYMMAVDTINMLIGWAGQHIINRDMIFCRYMQARAEFE
jgi:hemerythrin-like metal-binding protein